MTDRRKAPDQGVYGSHLSEGDWACLRDVIWPFLHASDPSSVAIPSTPPHLRSHRLVILVRKYRQTGEDQYLDAAGQLLIPTGEPFGWYVPLTK
jgi:hypothetical protein